MSESKVEDRKLLEISSPPNHDHAYVWLLMRGEAYLPGIYTSVYSVLRTDPDADLVVMVTPDVSQSAIQLILNVATHIFTIPYLEFESKPLKTARQRKIYSSWISVSYSKWNMLALPYKKAIFIDADTIHTENTDDLFELKAPAAPLANPFVKPLGTMRDFYKGQRGKDNYPIHGSNIPTSTVLEILNIGGMLPTAAPVLLEPSLDDYNSYIDMVRSMQPFGFPNCNNGPDEQSICYFYSKIKGLPWTSIHQRYNYIAWKDGFLIKGDVPRILHYFSDTKPWVMSFNQYEDVITWYKMAGEAIDKTNITAENILLTAANVEMAKKAADSYIKKFINVDSVLDIIGRLRA
jgi:lipopolysaccharide biosynthesis glycosyltransferase